MSSLLSLEDLRDVYIKLCHRGAGFLMSKFSLDNKKRTKSSFNDSTLETANWWIVPAVRHRWNKLITGNPHTTFEEYLSFQIFPEKRNMKMLSMGSGVCSHELLLAELNPHWDITCIDFSNNLIEAAEKKARKQNLKNITFLCEDIYQYPFLNNHYDIIFFNASLHHISSVSSFIYSHVYTKLKERGSLVINEYIGPNRIQYSSGQIQAINEGLALIDDDYKQVYKTKIKKKRYYGSGLWRMIVSDPSECVDSAAILSSIYHYFNVEIERPYGGNILMPALRDIAHHFVDENSRSMKSLQKIMDFEDQYLSDHTSDFVFGVYTKKEFI